MSWQTITVIAVLGLLVIGAIAKILYDRKHKKGCNGNCASCNAACKKAEPVSKEDIKD